MGYLANVGLDSVASIETRYEPDGRGSNPGGGKIFCNRTGPGAYPVSCTMGSRAFPGIKRPGIVVDHPLPSSSEVKEKVELYLYSPSRPSWPVIG